MFCIETLLRLYQNKLKRGVRKIDETKEAEDMHSRN